MPYAIKESSVADNMSYRVSLSIDNIGKKICTEYCLIVYFLIFSLPPLRMLLNEGSACQSLSLSKLLRNPIRNRGKMAMLTKLHTHTPPSLPSQFHEHCEVIKTHIGAHL